MISLIAQSSLNKKAVNLELAKQMIDECFSLAAFSGSCSNTTFAFIFPL